MKRTICLNLILVFTLISCGNSGRKLHGLNEGKLENETKEYILSDKQARNYVKKEVGKISEFEVNLLSCYPKELLIKYLEKEINGSMLFIVGN